MWLLPRGFFKTSLFTYTHDTALALANPNIRILQVSGVLANAKAMVSKIGKTFTHNDLFRMKFPNHCPENAENPKTKWTESVVTLPNRTIEHAEGTFEAMGVDSTIVSRHYDYMKFDDLVTPENSTTRDQLQKIIDFFEECQALADRRGFTPVDVYGTTWDDGDLYSYLKEKSGVEVIIVPATYQKKRGKTIGLNLPYKENETIFPERYPTKELKQFEKDDPHTYAMFYDLDPVPLGERTFTDFTYYEDLPGNFNEYRKFMTVDPAPTTDPTSNYSAIEITATDKNTMYILLSWRDKLNPDKLIDKIWEYYFAYECESIGIETDVYQVALKYWLIERMKNDKKHRYMKIVELKARGRKKESRIAALSPFVNIGKIKFKKSQKTLIYSLGRFPKAKDKDEADALAYQLYIFKPSLYEENPEEPANCLNVWKRRMGKMRNQHKLAGMYIGH
jgi:predicted phage terminase large subunit-like protein